ncbi:MAG: glycosyltransferase [Cyanobacteria bacterium NC_groundwater_1444_Ag_S-0.65um_54_12]|nr:glycosyltransferase [Cyanobacteria bacterium NC_groundwater_1444_Ag_S-0.65um_54_12]
MLRAETIICLSSSPWKTTLPTATHFLMRELAQQNHVLFVERAAAWRELRWMPRLRLYSYPEKEFGLRVLTPPPVFSLEALPSGIPLDILLAINGAVLRACIKRALAQISGRLPILWVGCDLFGGAALAGTLEKRLAVYHCSGDLGMCTTLPRHANYLERRLAANTQVIFANSPALACSKIALGPEVEYLPDGIDYLHFAAALSPKLVPPDAIAYLPRPIIGYLGNLAEQVDYLLLEAVACAFADGTLLIIGAAAGHFRERVRILELFPNVRYLGPIADDQVPAYLKGFDVALLPFRRGPVSDQFILLKANECLATGRPVVVAGYTDLASLSYPVRCANDPNSFMTAIRQALCDKRSDSALAFSRFAEINSWQRRAQRVQEVIGTMLTVFLLFGVRMLSASC